jgi:uncharacterized cupredoxin-like copper-binding protein
MSRLHRLFMLPAVLPVVLAAACATTDNRPITAQAQLQPNGVQTLDVDMRSDYFEPSTILVHANRPVELRVFNLATFQRHNFSLQDPSTNVAVDVRPGMSETVRFTPHHVGRFRFRCNVDGHAQKGMSGWVVVQP